MRAIVFSGGEFKGAVQVGCVAHLAWRAWLEQQGEDSGQRDPGQTISAAWPLPWRIYSGESTGCLQAACLAPGRYSDIDRLIRRWESLNSTGDIMTMRFGSYLRAVPVFKAVSLYSFRKLRRIIAVEVSDAHIERIWHAGNVLTVGTTDLEDLQYHVFGERTPPAMLRQMIEASCSVPGYFEGVERSLPGGLPSTFVDGGIRHITPLGEAIKAGATEIDLILASPLRPASVVAPRTVLGRALRAVDGLTNEIMRKDLKELAARNVYPRAGDRTITVRVYMPTETPNAPWSLKRGDFSRMFDIGAAMSMRPYTIAEALAWPLKVSTP